MSANPVRGEVALPLGGVARVLRPSFSALVAAEEEAGSLFLMLDRAASGQARISDMSALFWNCLGDRQDGEGRASFEAALLAQGVAALLPVYRALLSAVFGGR
ncbi:gene transfer agent family protein [Sandaracinobacter neustonicus]|uniref:Gene transfer agent family protein n=1 Tax=Sandaracinobacter neustonicus TaxID=1715348 RepID=A0A501XDJ3_9SPHN|nr:gene transfer agent family protein [Sandaracinobacter neustonicus]TPE58519.1 gene transfer agent family protein [Sandaracinobacter neustonicus]